MHEILTSILFLLGSIFSLVAAVGMFRLPDIMTRMHAATKAGTLGAGLILIGEAVYFFEIAITLKVIATILFLFLTAPVAAHLISRAAYHSGIRLWDKTWVDQLGEFHKKSDK